MITLRLLLFVLLLPISGWSQLLIDYDCEAEVGEMILNYRQSHIKEFNIHYTCGFNSQRPWKDVFRYRFLNDSVVHHRYKRNKQRWTIRNSAFIPELQKVDSLLIEKQLKNTLYQTSDSAGFSVSKVYTIKDQDTLLQAVYAVKKSGNEKTVIRKDVFGTTPIHEMTITRQISDGVKEIEQFVFRENSWQPKSVRTETLTVNETATCKTTELTTISRSLDAGLLSVDDPNMSYTFKRKTRVFYNSTKRIEKVEITEENRSGITTTVLTPEWK